MACEMKVAPTLAGLLAAGLAVTNAAGSAHPSESDGGRSSAVSCADAIYTAPANAPPKPVEAVQLGPAMFNSLAHLISLRGLGSPSKALPLYTVKSPLTILARARRGATVRIVEGGKNVALIYDRKWLQRLASWHYNFADVPRTARFSLCLDHNTTLPLNTQYAGGFLLRRPGCATLEVQAIGETQKHRATIPIGIRHC
jgi:hypothetical protein